MGQERCFPGTQLQEYKPLPTKIHELYPRNSLPVLVLLLADASPSPATDPEPLQAADAPRPLRKGAKQGCSDHEISSGFALSKLWHWG